MDNVAQTQHVIEWFGMRSGVFLEPKKKLENTSASQSAVHLTDLMGWEEA